MAADGSGLILQPFRRRLATSAAAFAVLAATLLAYGAIASASSPAVSGTVLDETGAPVDGVDLFLYVDNGDGRPAAGDAKADGPVTTGVDGTYEVRGSVPGLYWVVPSTTGAYDDLTFAAGPDGAMCVAGVVAGALPESAPPSTSNSTSTDDDTAQDAPSPEDPEADPAAGTVDAPETDDEDTRAPSDAVDAPETDDEDTRGSPEPADDQDTPAPTEAVDGSGTEDQDTPGPTEAADGESGEPTDAGDAPGPHPANDTESDGGPPADDAGGDGSTAQETGLDDPRPIVEGAPAEACTPVAPVLLDVERVDGIDFVVAGAIGSPLTVADDPVAEDPVVGDPADPVPDADTPADPDRWTAGRERTPSAPAPTSGDEPAADPGAPADDEPPVEPGGSGEEPPPADASEPATPQGPPQAPPDAARVDFAGLPLSFERNEGQLAFGHGFAARSPGYTVALTERAGLDVVVDAAEVAGFSIRLVGANRVDAEGVGELPGRSHYLFGNDPAAWITDVRHFEKVRFGGVYRGVAVEYYGNGQELEYDFVLDPGADPSQIVFRVAGASTVVVAEDGSLIMGMPGGAEVLLRAPVAYQVVAGERLPVEAGYVVEGTAVRIDVGVFDPSLALVIDPILQYGTYLGAVNTDYVNDVAVDASGAVYVTGWTQGGFPTTGGAYDTTFGGGNDVFVSKLSSDLSSLVWSTYIGGTSDEAANAIDVDGSGAAYVAGQTAGSDYPTTGGAWDTSFSGSNEAFVTKLTSDGSGLVWSTYLGASDGSDDDDIEDLVVAASGEVVVGGSTRASDFPITGGVFDTSYGPPGWYEGFITRLTSDGSALVWSTFVGGTDSNDSVRGVALDGTERVYAIGHTSSSDFPVTANAYDGTANSNDAQLVVISSDATTQVYGSVFGGGSGDFGESIAINGAGHAVFTGYSSGGWPTTAGAFDTTHSLSDDAVVAVVDPDEPVAVNTLVASTYLGGGGVDRSRAVIVDGSGRAWITGSTASASLATGLGADATLDGASDGFLASLTADLSDNEYFTYLGGSTTESGRGIALASSGDLLVGGYTGSADFPTPGGYDQSANGGTDGFIVSFRPFDPTAAAIADTGGAGPGEDLFTVIDPTESDPALNEWPIGTGTGTTSMRGADYDPLTESLYAAAGDTLGTLNTGSGLFVPIGTFGTATSGPVGAVTLDDVRALAFSPIDGTLYAVHHRGTGANDVLFIADPATGSFVAGAFGGDDYVVIQAQATRFSVSAIAVDIGGTIYGDLYAVGSANHRLATIDPADGSTTNEGDFGSLEIWGLDFDEPGSLWGIGFDSALPAEDRLYEFDLAATVQSSLVVDDGSDYQAVAFPVPLLDGVTGRVFLDLVGDGYGDGLIGSAANPPRSGVDVYLYVDSNPADGAPNATDTLWGGGSNPVTTDGAGRFIFGGVPDGDYWVAVDSSTVAPVSLNVPYTAGHTWAEQTVGSAGAWCDDGTGSPAVRVAAGPCYGGLDGASADALPSADPSNAEHVTALTVAGAAVTGVDFGFSFDVVVTTDATVRAADDTPSAQGSLDQFLANANAVAGANTMRFVPAVPANDGSGSWWVVDYTATSGTDIESVHDAATTIDGRAHDLADGATVVDQNPGHLGANAAGGLTVGVDDVALPQVARPELQIHGAGIEASQNAGAGLVPNGVAVHRLAVTDAPFASVAVNPAGAGEPVVTGVTVSEVVLGSSPDTFTGSVPSGVGHHMIAFAADAVSLTDSLLGWSDDHTVAAADGASNVIVRGNEIRGSDGDAVDFYLTSTGVLFEENLVAGAADWAIDAIGGTSTVRNNTFDGNGDGATQTGAIRFFSSGHTVENNVFTGNAGPAVAVAGDMIATPRPAGRVHITDNEFSGNAGLAIDLQAASEDNDLSGDGVTAEDSDGDNAEASHGNLGVDHPVISGAVLAAGGTTVSGTKCSGCAVEVYRAVAGAGDTFGADDYGEGVEMVATVPADALTSFAVVVGGLSPGDEVSAIQHLATGETSQFSPNETVYPLIAGTVFEDIAGDALAGGAQSVGDAANPGTVGVTVWLFVDDGDGIPDSGDTPAAGVTNPAITDAAGDFAFTSASGDDYWLVVDSRTIGSVQDPAAPLVEIWAEQTYGPVGAWCADPAAAGATVQGIGAAGPCFGGRRVDATPANQSSDRFADPVTPGNPLGSAEHLVVLDTTGAAAEGLDLGFSFDVVATTRGGGSTDDDSGTARTVQGSLRQFMANANAIVPNGGTGFTGENTMRFVPAQPTNASGSGGAWWRIQIDNDVPTVLDAGTTIDGTAYDPADGVTPLDLNPGTVGTGGTVGLDDLAATSVPRPELEIANKRFRIDAANAVVRDLAMYDDQNVEVKTNADGFLLEDALIGARADGADPVGGLRSKNGVFTNSAASGTVRNVFFGWTEDDAILLKSGSDGWLIEQSEFFDVAWNQNQEGAITIDTSGAVTIRASRIATTGGAAIDTELSTGGDVVDNNDVSGAGWRSDETFGLRIGGDITTVSRNVIHDNIGAGVAVINGTVGVRVTENSTHGNGDVLDTNGDTWEQIGIDLLVGGDNDQRGGDGNPDPDHDWVTINDDGDGDSGGNGALNFPVLVEVGNTVDDLVVTGFAPADAIVEVFISDEDGLGFGEGETFLFARAEGSGNDTLTGTGSYGPAAVNGVLQGEESSANRFRFTVAKASLPVVLTGTELITATATVEGPAGVYSTSEFSGNTPITDLITLDVTKTSDVATRADPGDTVTYSITVENVTTEDQTNVSIFDTLTTAPLPADQYSWVSTTVRTLTRHDVGDDFSVVDYSNSTGTDPWPTAWTETDDDGLPGSGDVRIELNNTDVDPTPRDVLVVSKQYSVATRAVDLTGAVAATISFEYGTRSMNGSSDYVDLEVWDDAGGTWVKLAKFWGSDGWHGATQYDVAQYASPNFAIRFKASPDGGMGDNDRLYVADLVVDYSSGFASAPGADPGGPLSDFTLVSGETLRPGETIEVDVVVTIDGGATATSITNLAEATADQQAFRTSDTAVDTVQQPPAISPQAFAIDENSAPGSSIGFVASSDPNGDPRTYAITAGDGGMISIVAGTGELQLVGTPDHETQDTYALTVEVDDGFGGIASNTVTVNISDINEAPVLDAHTLWPGWDSPTTTLTRDEEIGIGFTVTGSDVDVGDSLAYSLSGEPAGAAITGGGAFSWTPTEAQGPGSHTFDVIVTDAGLLTDTQTITIEVTDINEPPVVVDPGSQVNDELDVVSLFVAASDDDVPVNTLAWDAIGLPPGLGINTVTGEISGTLALTAAGSYSVTVWVEDDGTPMLSDAVVFDWDVNEVGAGLTVTKASDGGGSVLPGDTVEYTITVTNIDAVEHQNIQVTDAVPPGTTFVPGTVDVTIPGAYRDEFNASGYSGSDGTLTWSTSWAETDDLGNPGGNEWSVSSNNGHQYALKKGGSPNEAVERTGVDLAGSLSATLTFDYRRENLAAGYRVDVEVSDDGGATWSAPVFVIQGPADDAVNQASGDIDVSAWISNDMAVRFVHRGAGLGPGRRIYVDDVQVRGDAVMTVPGTPPPNLVPAGYHLRPGDAMVVTYQVTVDDPPTVASVDNTAAVASDQETGSVTSNVVSDDIANRPPVVDAGADQVVDEGDLVSLDPATYVDDDYLEVNTATIDWGDGSPVEAGTVDQVLDTVSGSHVYVDNGLYTVTVSVADDELGGDSDTFTVTVGNVAPVTEAGADQAVDEGDAVNLDPASFTDVGSADTHSATIDWGDGSPVDAGVVDQGLDTVSGSHVYADDGVYTVTVTVTDDDGGFHADTLTVTVGNVAPMTFAGLDQAVDEGDVVNLDPASFTDAGSGDTHTATIDWGDGSPVDAGVVDQGLDTVSGSHVYADDGVYTVTVTVTDDDGGFHADTLTVTVANVAPVTVAGADQSVDEGDVVSLDPASFTDAGSGDTHTATIDWGDGSPVDAGVVDQGLDTVSGSHVYADDGVYTVTVTVTDDDGGFHADTLTVTVANVAPVTEAGADQSVDEGDVVSLDPASFTDAGSGDTHTATIDWGDGSPVDAGVVDQGLDTVSGSHVYADDGVYTVTVTVTDDDAGFHADTLTVTVANVDPVTEAGADQSVDEGDVVSLDPASFTDAGSGDTHTATIDWGDGSPVDAGVVDQGLDTVSGSHVYADDGVYTVTVTVTDDDAGFHADTLTVTVANVAPVTEAGADQSVDEGDVVSLDPASFTDAGSGDTHTATIDWGDGSPVDAGVVDQGLDTVSGSHVYADDGVYTVTVTVTDDDAGFHADTLTVTVANVDPVTEAGADQSVDEGDVVSLDPASFTDAGSGDTHTATIDWGDGSPVDAGVVDQGLDTVSGSHVYADDGVYTVTVTVTDDDAGFHADTLTVTVANVDPVTEAGADQSVDEGDVVSLDPASFTDAGSGDTHTATVDWGDGSPVDAGVVDQGLDTVSGSHVYADDGVYTVTVTVTDDDAGFHADTLTVTVANVAPVTVAGADQSVDEGDVVSLDPASFTDAGSGDTHTATIDWGDGSPVDAGVVDQGLDTVSGSHVYADDGVYTVTVTVTDDDGGVGVDTLIVTAGTANPVVAAGSDQAVDEGDVVALDPASFTDAGSGDTHTATIDWGDGTPVDAGTVDQGLDTVSGSHVYADNGIYTVTVTVTDDDGGVGVDTLIATVSNAPPVATAGSDQAVDEGDVVALDPASFTDAGSGDTHTATIDWGDGTPVDAGVVDQGLDTVSGSHVYADNGIYTVTVTVTDDDGGSHADSLTVTVANVAPAVNAGTDQTIDEGDTALLDPATFIDAGSGDTHTATVDWGDGSAPVVPVVNQVADTVPASHLFVNDGVYTVTVTVTDDDGAPSADDMTVTVLNRAPVVDPGPDQAIVEGSSVDLSGVSFTDAGAADTHSATIDWGDGTTTIGSVDPFARLVDGAHTYVDDGTYTVRVTVVDDAGGVGTADKDITIGNAAPIVDSGSASGDEGAAVTIEPVSFTDAGAADTHTATIDWGDGTVTSASVDASNRTVSASHEYVDDGFYAARVTVIDDAGGEGSAAIGVTIDNVAPEAVITGDPDGIREGLVASLIGSAVDPGADEFTYAWTVLLEDAPYTTGSGADFSFTPDAPGGYRVELTVTDDDGGVSAPATLSFQAIPDLPPVALGETYRVEDGATLDIDAPGLLANDSDPEGLPLSAVLLDGPRYGDLAVNPFGSFRYVHDGTKAATDSFTYVVSDGRSSSVPVTVTFELYGFNDPPVANDDVVRVAEDGAVTVSPLGNDSDPDGDRIELVFLAEPLHGTLSRGTGGRYTYVPEPDWNGSLEVSYTIADPAGETATAALLITVRPVNDPPDVPDRKASMERQPSITFDLLDGVTDIDSDVLSVTVSSPGHGTAFLDAGRLTYHPLRGYTGTDQFTYTVDDGAGGRVTRSITIDIVGVDDGAILLDLVGIDPITVQDDFEGSSLPGFNLLVGSVFQTFELLRLPLLVLAGAFLLSLFLGLSTAFAFGSGPVYLPPVRPSFYGVVLTSAGSTISARQEPGDRHRVLHEFVAAERDIRTTGRHAQIGRDLWVEVEIPGGEGWVDGAFITEQIAEGRFASDERPPHLVEQLVDLIETTGSLVPIVSPLGFHVAHFSPPERIPDEDLDTLLADDTVWSWWNRSGSIQELDGTFYEVIGEPLFDAYQRYGATPGVEPSVEIPRELNNFSCLTIGDTDIPGKDAWRVFFDYRDDDPRIVAIWREGLSNPSAMGTSRGRRLLASRH